MASPLVLKTAIGTYEHTKALKDGTITSDRIALDFIEFLPANRAFRPMANDLAFDVSEMAITTYILAKVMNRPLAGIPITVHRLSPYASIVCNIASGITTPKDLEGRTIAVRAYAQTTGIWLRGVLEHEFNVDLSKLSWITAEDAHVDGFVDPPSCRRAEAGKTLLDLVTSGEADAAVSVEVREAPEVLRALFPNAKTDEAAWSARTGIYPINHVIVIKQELADAHPWLKAELFDMFDRSRKLTMERTGLPVMEYGLNPANRLAVDTVAGYVFEQGVSPRIYSVEELFQP